ncbi:MAG: helix-turn-helix domain-containing protein [Neisseriaceae bacterium]|nr:helix-turn-helix domain-containing protein [Neisseriaceae bacterium]MBP6862136.1 helix-turn-helix domain-containing protein [Neisseriaceae bacterium]
MHDNVDPAEGAALSPVHTLGKYKGDPDFMASLARGLLVIGAFSKQRRRQTIADLARHTSLPRATVRRCLYTLKALGYVDNDDNLYHLKPKVLTLGYAYLSSTDLAVTAQPFLEQVSNEVNESCSLAVLENDTILYVGRSPTKRVMSVVLTVGSRLPAYCSSMGRVILAAKTPAQRQAYYERVKLLPLTEHTVYKPEALEPLLQQAATQGYALVNQELELGLCSLAVPVRNLLGETVGAINISTHASRFNEEAMLTQLLPALRRAATDLSAQLGL